MGTTRASGEINRPRASFFGAAAVTVAATQFGIPYCRRADGRRLDPLQTAGLRIGLDRRSYRGELGSARPALEFSIAQLRDEAAQPVAVASSTRAAAPVLLCPSLTLERHGFTRYSFAWLAV